MKKCIPLIIFVTGNGLKFIKLKTTYRKKIIITEVIVGLGIIKVTEKFKGRHKSKNKTEINKGRTIYEG